MRVAGTQMPVTCDVERNTLAILDSLEWVVREGADLLITPEGQ
jgi:predicted amidohydrolase